MAKSSLFPFALSQGPQRKSIGGANARVQNASEAMQSESVPFVAARIYASPSLQMYDDTDPRYDGKSDAVENIYNPAPAEEKRPNGFTQILNWLTTGRMY